MATIKGSLELITGTPPNDISRSTTVEAATPALVPTIVQAVYGITGLQPAAIDPAQPLQVAAWTATDTQFRPVRILLWQEPEFDATAIGQALKAVQEGGDA